MIRLSQPSTWVDVPLWSLLRRKKELNRPHLPLLSVYRDYGVVRKDSRDDNYNKAGADLSDYQVVKPGDVVANKMKTWQGSIAVSELEGLVSPAYIVCATDVSVHPRFLHYQLRSRPYIAEYRRLSHGVRPTQWDLRWEDLRTVRVWLPPHAVQTRIGNFLDRETGQIDALVEKKRRLIELLEEKRTALISHVVTGSANDPITKLGFHVDLLPGFAFPSSGYLSGPTDGDAIPLLRGVNVSPGHLRWEDTVYWPAHDAAKYQRYALREDDVVLGMDRPWIGSGMRVAKVTAEDVPSLLLQRVARLRALPGLDQDYLLLLLASRQFLAYFEPILTGVSVPHISPDQIAGFRFALPTPSQQRVAVEMVDAQSTKITALISNLRKQLDLLAEYRQALITAAVTGQIDVDAEVPEPEEALA